jgi:hypothetical protein
MILVVSSMLNPFLFGLSSVPPAAILQSSQREFDEKIDSSPFSSPPLPNHGAPSASGVEDLVGVAGEAHHQ